MKWILTMFVLAWSLSSFATSQQISRCPQALPDNHSGFCASFKSVAECHCTESGLPKGMCQNMNSLYDRMISMFGSLQKACAYQHDTTTQACIDDWNCYRIGNADSGGNLCSGTGHACQ